MPGQAHPEVRALDLAPRVARARAKPLEEPRRRGARCVGRPPPPGGHPGSVDARQPCGEPQVGARVRSQGEPPRALSLINAFPVHRMHKVTNAPKGNARESLGAARRVRLRTSLGRTPLLSAQQGNRGKHAPIFLHPLSLFLFFCFLRRNGSHVCQRFRRQPRGANLASAYRRQPSSEQREHRQSGKDKDPDPGGRQHRCERSCLRGHACADALRGELSNHLWAPGLSLTGGPDQAGGPRNATGWVVNKRAYRNDLASFDAALDHDRRPFGPCLSI